MWPVNKPIAKIEGQSQCSGEAEFVGDIAPAKGELCAAFVISDAANCDIDVVDPSEALVASAAVLLASNSKATLGWLNRNLIQASKP